MLDILNFVFSGFWTFVGTMILIGTIFQGGAALLSALADIIAASRGRY